MQAALQDAGFRLGAWAGHKLAQTTAASASQVASGSTCRVQCTCRKACRSAVHAPLCTARAACWRCGWALHRTQSCGKRSHRGSSTCCKWAAGGSIVCTVRERQVDAGCTMPECTWQDSLCSKVRSATAADAAAVRMSGSEQQRAHITKSRTRSASSSASSSSSFSPPRQVSQKVLCAMPSSLVRTTAFCATTSSPLRLHESTRSSPETKDWQMQAM